MTTIHAHNETRTFTSARQEEFKPWLLGAVQTLNLANKTTEQASVLAQLAETHGHDFTESEWTPSDHAKRVNQPYNWCQIATNAATELRKDGYLAEIDVKGGSWRLTGKGGYTISPSRMEQQAAINVRAADEIKANACPTCRMEMLRGRCVNCF